MHSLFFYKRASSKLETQKWYVTGPVVSLELARITVALCRFIFSPPLVSSVSRFARNTACASLGSIAG